MPFINDRVFDLGLNVLDTEANRLDICSAEPTTYTQATSTNSLGNKTGLAIPAPSDHPTNGRRVAVPSISDGTVTATGTATHWAITDTTNSRLLATGALSASQAVTNGNVFTLTTFDVRIPDAA